MKQRHLLIVLFALLSMVQARADVAINETNFPDDEFRFYVEARFGDHEHGRSNVITDEKIANTHYISISNLNIKNLKGIEFFTALKTLICRVTELTALDVSGCTALEKLECFDNDQLTSLDVSGCTALKTLICRGRTQLTALDVSGCTALEKLECLNNDQLTKLDLSGCSTLTNLDCGGNQLTALDVSGCSTLTNLDCGGNQLTALDVSGCTALTELN